MPITAAQLAVRVVADTLPAEAGLGRVAGLMGKGLPVMAVGAVAAVAGIGIAATKMAGDFQAGVTQLVTGAGESKNNLKIVSDGILGVATSTGTSTQQLLSAMFNIESGSYHGAAGLAVLKVAAEGAKASNSDLGVTATALVGIMNAYASQHVTAAQAMNILTGTVQNGLTHMQDLAGAMPQVLSTASATGIRITDLAGAMATLTSQTVPAANAATYIRQLLIALEAPSKQSSKALAAIGLTSTDVANAMHQSLPGALQLIQDHLSRVYKEGSPQYVAALKAIAGGSKQMQGLLDLTGSHLKTFKDDVADISGKVKNAGSSVMGWSDVQNTFNFKLDRAKEVVETLMIRIGTHLLPVAGKLADFFSANLIPTLNTIVTVIGTVINVSVHLATVLHNDVQNAVETVHRTFTTFRDGAVAAFDGTKRTLLAFRDGAVAAFVAVRSAIASAIAGVVDWFNKWKPVILTVAGILATIFGPTLIQMGVQAAIAGGQIAASFVAQMATAGATAVAQGARMAASFTTEMVTSGATAVAQGARIAATFVVSMVQSGIQAVKTAAQMTATLIPAMIQTSVQFARTAAEGIASGTVALVQFAAKGYIAAGAMLSSIVPAVISTTTSFVTMAATAIAGAIAGFVAYIPVALSAAVATLAAAAPFIAVGLAIAGVIAIIVLLVTHWKQVTNFLSTVWKLVVAGVKLDFQIMGAAVNILGSIVGKIPGFFGAAFGGLWGIVKQPIDLIIGGINTLIRGLDSIHFNVPSWVPGIGGKGFGISIPQIPLLAQGGNITQSGYVVVGDDGPELLHLPAGAQVAPLTNPSPIRGLPAGMQPAYGAATATANGIPIQLNVYLNPHKVAQIVTTLQPGVIRNGTGNRSF